MTDVGSLLPLSKTLPSSDFVMWSVTLALSGYLREMQKIIFTADGQHQNVIKVD